MNIKSYDLIGQIAILKFPKGTNAKDKKKFAEKLLKENKSRIKTVVEKAERVKGILRTIKTKHLAGEKNLRATHKENGCIFHLDIEKCYFSPRLSEERKSFINLCKKNEKILVMFGGIGVFGIVIAKNNKNVKKIISVEIGKECNKYAFENVKLNKVTERVEIIPGDVKRILPMLKKRKEVFDRIIMARPNLKYSFLKEALMASKKNTIIYYYAFCHKDNIKEETNKLIEEANKCKRKIKLIEFRKAGDIAPGKFRHLITFKVLK